MPLRKTLSAVEPYKPQKPMRALERGLGIERIVKLASSEGAFGPLPAALGAAGAVRVTAGTDHENAAFAGALERVAPPRKV